MQHLDRDDSTDAEVLRLVDISHPALADQTRQEVSRVNDVICQPPWLSRLWNPLFDQREPMLGTNAPAIVLELLGA
jgi:hypothetical protein